MDQETVRSEWYRQDAGQPAPHSPEKKKKKHPVMKTVMIVVFVLILIAASAFLFAEEKRIEDSSASGFNGNFTIPDDYRDFFEDYFTDPVNTITGSQLSRTETGTGVTLPVESAADLPLLSLQDVYTSCVDSIVGVSTSADGAALGWGSGIVMTEDGYILTNTHVISGAQEATVILSDGREYPALLVGEDTQTDIAVLKIEAEGLRAARFGSSEELLVGDRVVAIGNPLGDQFSGTMTDGIVSAINRDVNIDGKSMTLIQTNAALNNGNSGGPLINMYGQVVGITNLKMVAYYSQASIEGIGFAIPSATMKTVVDQLIAEGAVLGRPSLGITVGPIPEAAAEHYQLPFGLYVSAVSERSDAYERLQVGDVITHANGKPLRENADLLAIRDEHQVGDVLTLTVSRDGETLEIPVTILDTNDVY